MEVVGHLRRALDLQEVNWRSVLSMASITLVTFSEAADLIAGQKSYLFAHARLTIRAYWIN